LKLNKKIELHEYVFITELYQVISGTLKLKDLLNAEKDEKGKRTYKKWSRIDLQKYKDGKRGTAYVTKYVLKENNRLHAEYDILI
jgi:Mg/Co/Ni transporter MgtE